MSMHQAPCAYDDSSLREQKLCSLLLEAVGQGSGRIATAKRYAEIMSAALPYMNAVQASAVRDRIHHLETRWGSLLPGSEYKDEYDVLSPETRVARWLSKRPVPIRHLRLLRRAALLVWDGETRLMKIMDGAYAKEFDMVLRTVGMDSFREWLIELRIARHVAKTEYGIGPLCRWWIDEMSPDKPQSDTYKRCMQQMEELSL